jgi:hypothetical protein
MVVSEWGRECGTSQIQISNSAIAFHIVKSAQGPEGAGPGSRKAGATDNRRMMQRHPSTTSGPRAAGAPQRCSAAGGGGSRRPARTASPRWRRWPRCCCSWRPSFRPSGTCATRKSSASRVGQARHRDRPAADPPAPDREPGAAGAHGARARHPQRSTGGVPRARPPVHPRTAGDHAAWPGSAQPALGGEHGRPLLPGRAMPERLRHAPARSAAPSGRERLPTARANCASRPTRSRSATAPARRCSSCTCR